jgi:hypothetical protein
LGHYRLIASAVRGRAFIVDQVIRTKARFKRSEISEAAAQAN